MTNDIKEAGHPLDRQNAIERAIQLEGPKDPDKFKMPDGRTLTDVRESNQKSQDAEYQEEIQMLARRTREQSIPEFQKGEKLVMTSTGNLIDVTEPPMPEDAVTMAKSRTTAAEISEGVIQPRREPVSNSSSAQSGETASSSGTPAGISPSTSSPPPGSSSHSTFGE